MSPPAPSTDPPCSPLQYLQASGNNWRWFDDRSGRWCSYSASNNSTIDAAWRSGESSVRFTAGRRRYTVQFTTMVQVRGGGGGLQRGYGGVGFKGRLEGLGGAWGLLKGVWGVRG